MVIYPLHVLGTSQQVTSVKPRVPEGHSKQRPGASQTCWPGWSFSAGCSRAGISHQGKPQQHSNACSIPAAGTRLWIGV